MYVYEVKHLPSGEFYIGYESATAVAQAQSVLDPGGKFSDLAFGSNKQLPVRNVIKNVLFKGGTESELKDYAIKYAKNNENNKFFLGLITPNAKEVLSVKVETESLKTKENNEIQEVKKDFNKK